MTAQPQSEPWPPSGVRSARLANGAGPIRLAPAFEHRVLVHASPSTWSVCPSSGQSFLRRRGHIDILPAGEEGGFDAEAPCETLEVRLPPGLIERVAAEAGCRTAGSGLSTRHMLEDERIRHLAEALESERVDPSPAGRLFVGSIGVALATQLLGLTRPVSQPARGLSAAQLQRVFDHVDRHLEQPLSLDALARAAGASSAHLRHWFKVQTGMTVHRYVVRQRVERARTLLMQGTMKASEIALAAGFAHQSHMARWMKRELGQVPGELTPGRRGAGGSG